MCFVLQDLEVQFLIINSFLKKVFNLLKNKGSEKCEEVKKALIFKKLNLMLLIYVLLSKCFDSFWMVTDFMTSVISSSQGALKQFLSFDLTLLDDAVCKDFSHLHNHKSLNSFCFAIKLVSK